MNQLQSISLTSFCFVAIYCSAILFFISLPFKPPFRDVPGLPINVRERLPSTIQHIQSRLQVDLTFYYKLLIIMSVLGGGKKSISVIILFFPVPMILVNELYKISSYKNVLKKANNCICGGGYIKSINGSLQKFVKKSFW
jgi:hypothetical protein